MGCTSKVILVCEDVLHRAFIRVCLKKLGVENLKRNLRCRDDAKDIGSVIRIGVEEFDAWKRRNSHNKAFLVIVADADDKTRCDRKKDFPNADKLSFENLFVLVIPKQNIETWIQLGEEDNPQNSQDIDEKINYKKTIPENKRNSTKKINRTKVAAKNLCDLFLKGNMECQNVVWQHFVEDMTALKCGIDMLRN